MAEKVQTTLRISPEVHEAFKKSVKGKKMSTQVEELMREYAKNKRSQVETERVKQENAVALIVKAVCDELADNTEWADHALLRAGLTPDGSSTFHGRYTHFIEEKQELANRLSRVILRRSLNALEKGRKVFVVADSGTTVFWFLQAFAREMEKHFKKLGGGRSLEGLTIVTNNIPGAERLMTYISQQTVTVEGEQKLISDMIRCRMLAGNFLPEYVAMTGSDTEEDLVSYHTRFRKDGVFIGITTGNWMTLLTDPSRSGSSGDRETLTPHLFARGDGHGPFKQKLIEVCDEVFAISPLGKLFVKTDIDQFNRILGYGGDSLPLLRRRYEQVETPADKKDVVKIVATTRKGQSVLRTHSGLMETSLDYEELKDEEKTIDEIASFGIAEMPHLLFPFDRFSNRSPEEQLQTELPHEATRTNREFMSKVLHIDSNLLPPLRADTDYAAGARDSRSTGHAVATEA